MKKFTLVLLVAFLASCHNYREDAEQLQREVDSLESVTTQKDEAIEGFLGDFTAIQANLDSIKQIEDLIDVPDEPEQAINENRRQRIVADLAAINRLLNENKELIASLRTRLNNTNLRTGQLESMINELEQLSQNLEEEVRQKDNEIENLTQQVEEQTEDIGILNERISEMQDLSAQQLDSIRQQEMALNTVYFTVGSIRELIDNGIIEREGGILGIGSTPVVREDFSEEVFTEVDLRDFDYLPLDARRADVISVHPAGSYHITGENSADTLYIDDPVEFWSASKYLVVGTR